jgi:glycosyltransferase involved in cell wall biosynthesis
LVKISVVVSTYSRDRLKDLLDCIVSLKKQSLKPDEIILVLDPCPNLVEFYESELFEDVRVVVSQRRGLSNARNAGVRSSRGEIVSFIDDDAVADENWLENLVKNYEDTNVVGVGGLIKPLWEDGYPTWFPEELNWIVGCSYKGLPERKASVRNPLGCNMSFRKTVFEKVGYFRSDIGRFGKKLLASEETELSMRVLSKIQNSKIIYEPSAIVHHKVNKRRGSLKYVWVRSFYEGLSKAMISYKSSPSTKLSTEVSYLKYLLSVAIPLRFKRIYKFEELSKLLTLLISLFAVVTGFVTGKTVREN